MKNLSPRNLSESVRAAMDTISKKGFSGSIPNLDILIQQNPDEEELYAFRNLVRLWSGDYEGAQRIADERLRLNPSAGMYGVASEIAHINGDLELSEKLLVRGQSLDPDNFLVLRQFATKLTMDSDPQASLSVLERSLELYPENPDTFASILVAMQMIGDMNRQQDILDNPPDWFKGTSQFYRRRGMLALQRHELENAESDLRYAVARCSGGGSYWAELGMILGHLSKFEESEQACRNALECNSRSPIALRALAKAAKHRGDNNAAEAYDIRADQAIPALKYLGLISNSNKLTLEGKHSESVDVLKEMIRVSPPTLSQYAHVILPNKLILANRWDEARIAQNEAVAICGERPMLNVSGFQLLVHEGKTDEAKKMLDALLNTNHIFPEFIPHAVSFLIDTGEESRAQELIDLISGTFPATPATYCALVMVLSNKNKKDVARSLFQIALKRYPNHSLMRLISVGFAAEDKDLAGLKHHISQLPPHMRPSFKSKLKPKLDFWEKLKKAMKNRKN